MNAYPQNKTVEGKDYYSKALKAASKVSDVKAVMSYLDLLVADANSENQFTLSETELNQILAVQQCISKDTRYQYWTMRALHWSLSSQNKYKESSDYLQRALAVVQNNKNFVPKDLSDLHLQLGMTNAYNHQMEKANQEFTKSLELDKDQNGFHYAMILFLWGHRLIDGGQIPQASEKLSLALKKANNLSAAKRGTLRADALTLLANIQRQSGNKVEAEKLERESSEEVKVQKQLGSKLGPDFFHRL